MAFHERELFLTALEEAESFQKALHCKSSLLQNGTGGLHNQKVLSVRHANSVSLEQGCCDPARSTAIE